MEAAANSVITAAYRGPVAAQAAGPQELFNRFVAYLDKSEATVKTYEKAIRRFIVYVEENGITNPQRAHIIAFKKHLTETGHKPTTLQTYLAALKQFFAWTEEAGLYPNITKNVSGVKLDAAHKRDYLTSEQARSILSGIDRSTEAGARDYAIFALCITGGLRTIEVSRANIEDMGTAGNNSILFLQGKGKTDRAAFVRLDPHVEAAIRAYLQLRGKCQRTEPLFTSTSNRTRRQRLTTRSISWLIKSAMQRAGFDSERLTAHSLRHSAVSLALLGGETLERVSQHARHASLQTTMIYNHTLSRQDNSCSNTVARMIF